MAWEDELVKMLRIVVNDIGDEPTYGDGRMEQTLAVAAQYVKEEVGGFDYTYDIDINTPDIIPDPTVVNDDAFSNMIVLKAACIIDQGTFRTKALQAGVKIKCGPAVLETLKTLDGFKQLLEFGPCAAYEEMKKQLAFGGAGSASVVKAILSPFCGNNFDPRSLANFSSCRNGTHGRMNYSDYDCSSIYRK
jgi:hypothetical protein